jgi:hypothetical protein
MIDYNNGFTLRGKAISCDTAYNAFVYDSEKATPTAKSILSKWKAEGEAESALNEKLWDAFNADPYSAILR